MRHVRRNPDRDEAKAPAMTDCLAHRCTEHAELPPMDAHADDGAECGICLAHTFIAHYEKAFEADVLKKLVWPIIDSCRDRLNILARGAGDQFVEEVRERVQAYEEQTT